MKFIPIWLCSLSKRLLKKPLFLLALFLIPLFVLSMRFSLQSEDAILRVALYTPETDKTQMEQQIIQKLLDSSNRSVHFYRCNSKEELIHDVKSSRASSGYLIPAHLEEKLKQHEQKEEPIIYSYRHADAITTKIIDEIIYSNLYSSYSYDILSEFIHQKSGTPSDERLQELYRHYQDGYSFIQFEYEDGSQNKILQSRDANYMMLPVRGMTAILILLTGMIGTLFWYEDERNKLFIRLTASKKPVISLLYLAIPCLMAGIAGIIAIFLTGFASSLWLEVPAMLLFLISIVAFCDLLRSLLPKLELFLAAIPISLIGSLVLCPVFVDLTTSLSWLKPLRRLTPVYHYLRALYSTRGKWELLCFSLLFFLLAAICRQLRWYHQTSRPSKP